MIGRTIREGILIRLSSHLGNLLKPVILDPEQHAILSETVHVWHGLERGDAGVIEKGEQLGIAILANRPLVAQLVRRAQNRQKHVTLPA